STDLCTDWVDMDMEGFMIHLDRFMEWVDMGTDIQDMDILQCSRVTQFMFFQVVNTEIVELLEVLGLLEVLLSLHPVEVEMLQMLHFSQVLLERKLEEMSLITEMQLQEEWFLIQIIQEFQQETLAHLKMTFTIPTQEQEVLEMQVLQRWTDLFP